MRNICPVHGLFNYINPWPETRNHPLASPLLSAGRRDAAVWTSRLRSGNSVWRHVLRCFVLRTSYFVCALGAGCPSTLDLDQLPLPLPLPLPARFRAGADRSGWHAGTKNEILLRNGLVVCIIKSPNGLQSRVQSPDWVPRPNAYFWMKPRTDQPQWPPQAPDHHAAHETHKEFQEATHDQDYEL
jgi:hypothetical protein